MCTAADAICSEHYLDDDRARILSQIVAIVNSVFAVPLFFTAVALLVHLLFVYMPARLCTHHQKRKDEGVLQQQQLKDNHHLLSNNNTQNITTTSATTTAMKTKTFYHDRSPYETTGGSSLEDSSNNSRRSSIQFEHQNHNHQVYSAVDIQ